MQWKHFIIYLKNPEVCVHWRVRTVLSVFIPQLCTEVRGKLISITSSFSSMWSLRIKLQAASPGGCVSLKTSFPQHFCCVPRGDLRLPCKASAFIHLVVTVTLLRWVPPGLPELCLRGSPCFLSLQWRSSPDCENLSKREPGFVTFPVCLAMKLQFYPSPTSSGSCFHNGSVFPLASKMLHLYLIHIFQKTLWNPSL